MDRSKRMEMAKRDRDRGGSGRNKKWLECLSPEARIAMQLALEDTKAMKEASNEYDGTMSGDGELSPTEMAFDDKRRPKESDRPTDCRRQPDAGSGEPSYTELYHRNGSSRMRRDVTDESYSDQSEPRRVLGGAGKVESAMEIVEIVHHDSVDDSFDDNAIDELAKINSVDKCAVWIEATQQHQTEQLPKIPETELESK